MNLLEIQARKIVAVFEEDLEGLEKIKTALDIASLNFSNDVEKEAAKYLTLDFYPVIIRTIETIKGRENV